MKLELVKKLVQIYRLNRPLDFSDSTAELWAEKTIANTLDFGAIIDRVLKWQGLDIGVEYLPGQVRFPGRRNSKKLRSGYGHIRRYIGADGEALDCYISRETLDGAGSNQLFRISQMSADDGDFDEYKFMIGYADIDAARAAYLKEMPSEFFGGIVAVNISDLLPFKKADFAESKNRITDRATLLQLKAILETAYKDGISSIPEAYLHDDDSFSGIFVDQVTPKVSKRLSFEISSDGDIAYQIINPEALQNFTESDWEEEFLDFAGAKPKQCKKGISCGNSCINKDKECHKNGTAATKAATKKAVTTAKATNTTATPTKTVPPMTVVSGRSPAGLEKIQDTLYEWEDAHNGKLGTEELADKKAHGKSITPEEGALINNRWIVNAMTTDDDFKKRAVKDSNGNIQAVATVKNRTKKNDDYDIEYLSGHKHEKHLEIEYLATSPYNLPGANAPNKVKGAGTRMIAEVVKESQKKGYGGRVRLVATPEAEKFYEKIGFKVIGTEPMGYKVYELSPSDATNFIKNIGD
jgi:hypothetical protein